MKNIGLTAFPSSDYAREDDYDLEGAHWMSATVLGSTFEVEVDTVSGKYRHRDPSRSGPWKEGTPQ